MDAFHLTHCSNAQAKDATHTWIPAYTGKTVGERIFQRYSQTPKPTEPGFGRFGRFAKANTNSLESSVNFLPSLFQYPNSHSFFRSLLSNDQKKGYVYRSNCLTAYTSGAMISMVVEYDYLKT